MYAPFEINSALNPNSNPHKIDQNKISIGKFVIYGLSKPAFLKTRIAISIHYYKIVSDNHLFDFSSDAKSVISNNNHKPYFNKMIEIILRLIAGPSNKRPSGFDSMNQLMMMKSRPGESIPLRKN